MRFKIVHLVIILAEMKNYSINKTPLEAQMEIAKRFKELRKGKKISQLLMAQKSGVSLGSLKRFETSGQISLESLFKLAHLFDRLDDFDGVFVVEEDLEKIKQLFNS